VIDAIRDEIADAIAVMGKVSADLAPAAAEAVDLVIAALRHGRRIFVCGDGGSAAQAQHLAGELVGRFLIDRPALPCIALNTDTSVLTAIANDYDFEDIFERQLEALLEEGDVLVALSTSGESPNVLKAAGYARQHGAKVIAFTGGSGGHLKQLADVCLCVPAETSPRVQEGHLLLLHILCRQVEETLFSRACKTSPPSEPSEPAQSAEE
jgi:D-sedoheptulose 7-phosphate isomerase